MRTDPQFDEDVVLTPEYDDESGLLEWLAAESARSGSPAQ